MKLLSKSLAIFTFLITLLLLLWGFTRYPKLVGDESIYVSQAWWLVHFKQLGPYTYWYDHFPLGWLLIGLWQKLTGGPFLLGIAEFSGRLFSILLVSLTACFITSITRTLTHKKLLIFLSLVLYATSPLGIVFHRQILLENIAVFFLWASLWVLIIKTDKSALYSLFSAFLLGLAILIKESLLFLLPAYFIYLFLKYRSHSHRHLLIYLSGLTLTFVLAFFPLLAFLKGELISQSQTSTISLVNTIFFQMKRTNGYPWWNPQSEIWQRAQSWLYHDPILLIMGCGAIIANLVTLKLSSPSTIFHLLTLSYFVFLLRGGLVLDHYIIPLISLLVMEITLFAHQLISIKPKTRFLIMIMIFSIVIYNFIRLFPLLSINAVKPQQDAYNYLVDHAQPNDVIAIDNFFLNLRFNPNMSSRFPLTQWHDKIDRDPAITAKTTQVNWLFYDWITKTQIDNHELPILEQSLTQMNNVYSGNLPDNPIVSSLYRNSPYVIEPISLYSSYSTPTQIPTYASVKELGQLFWIPLESDVLTETEKLYLQQHLVSGVVIEAQNITNSSQLPQLIKSVHQTSNNFTPIIAISFEGGSDTPIPWLTNINPKSIKSRSEAIELTSKKARQLHNMGINVILGPILDGDPNLTTTNLEFTTAIAESYQQNGLVSFFKWYGDNPEPFISFYKQNQLPSSGIIISPYISPDRINLQPLQAKTSFSSSVLTYVSAINLTSDYLQKFLVHGVTTFYPNDLTSQEDLIQKLKPMQIDLQLVNRALEINGRKLLVSLPY